MTLPEKITRLVAEHGWNHEEFARRSGLNRNTVYQLLTRRTQRLRNQTIRRCADALGVSVHALREWPLSRLLQQVARLRSERATKSAVDWSCQPELKAWMEAHPERARDLTPEEIDELLSLQGTGGPLTREGVEYFVRVIERKRLLKDRIDVIAGTEYLDLVEQIVDLIYQRIQPYGGTED